VPRWIEELVLPCLARDPNDRHRSMIALVAKLSPRAG
jgi:hypothetical protein